MIRGSQGVFGHNTPGVANDVGVSGFEAQDLRDDEPGIHARHDRQFASWREWKLSTSEVLGIGFVGFKDFIGGAHGWISCAPVKPARCSE